MTITKNQTDDKCHICGGAALTRGDGCGIEKCPYRGGPFSDDKEELVQRLLEVASLKRELSEAHAVLDKAEISRKRSMDGGQTWPEYSLAERVNIVCGALKMPDEDFSATLPTWIPVSEKMPPENVEVLCYQKNTKRMGLGQWMQRDDGKIWTFNRKSMHEMLHHNPGLSPTEFSHWMPLPNAPSMRD